MSDESPKVGYKRAVERHPSLDADLHYFNKWLESVEIWLTWVEEHIPNNVHASRTEVLEEFHFTPQGLEILERLNLDIYPEGRESQERTEYDVKKLLRAVVALPTVARLSGKRLDRKSQNINTVFKEVIDDTLNGRTNIESLSSWEKPLTP